MDISEIAGSPLDPQKKPYWQVLDEYHRALKQYPELQGTSMPEFSQAMGPQYAAGQNADTALRRGSGNIDIALHHFGGAEPGYQGPTLAEKLGGPREGWDLPKLVGGGVSAATQAAGGSPDLVRKFGQVGESIPRMAVDLGAGFGLGGLTGMALASGLSTYGETGSKLQAGISGLSTALMPTVAGRSGEWLASKVGGKAIAEAAPDLLNKTTRLAGDEVGQQLAKAETPTVWQNLARIAGGQAGMLGLGEATETAQILAGEGTGQEKMGRIMEQASPSSIAATAFAQLPWAINDLRHVGKTPDLNKAILEPAKEDFKDKFTAEYTKQQGVAPEPKVVQATMEKVLKGGKDFHDALKEPGPVGQTLASIGEAPISFDKEKPYNTKSGEWAPAEAIQEVKTRAKLIAGIRGEDIGELGDAHDQRISSALRAVDILNGGKLDKDEMSRQAALRVLSSMTEDKIDFGDISPEFLQTEKEGQDRFERMVHENVQDLDITTSASPQHPLTGEANPKYNKDLHTKLAMLQGTPEERAALAGQPNPLTPDLKPLPSTLTMSAGDQSDPGKVITIPDDMVSQIERDLNRQVDPVTELPKKTTLVADATFAARRAAAAYSQPVNPADPDSVRSFYNYVKKAVTHAQVGWNRLRGTEIHLADGEGNVIKYKTKAEAQVVANELNASAEKTENVRFAPSRNKKDGSYDVVKYGYARSLSSFRPEDREDEVRDLGKEALTSKTEAPGIPQETLSQFGETLKELERNSVQDQFKAQDSFDPAEREARKESIAKNVTDYLKGVSGDVLKNAVSVPGATKEWGLKTEAKKRAQFVAILKFLRDGGDLKIVPVTTKNTEFVYTDAGVESAGQEVKKRGKTGALRMTAEGDLVGLNKYMKEYGVGYSDPNTMIKPPSTGGMSLIEQFHLLTKHLSKEFLNPNKVIDMVERPRGDHAWMPHGYEDDLEKTLLIPWPQDYPKAIRRLSSEFSSAPQEKLTLTMQDRNGKDRMYRADLNPIATAQVKGTKYQLTMKARDYVKLYKDYVPAADKEILDLVTQMTADDFGGQIPIGFGIAKDPATKGYYHYGDDYLTGTGIIVSPFSDAPTNKHLRQLDRPEDGLPHLLNELAHARTVFGFHNDQAIHDEAVEIWRKVNSHHKAQMGVGVEGRFAQDIIGHALSDPREMIAAVFNVPLFRDYLKTIPDDSPRGGRMQTFGTIFDRIFDMIKRIMSKIVGDDGANTMLQRLTDLSLRTMQAQENLREHLGIKHEGDIYGAKTKEGNVVGDLVIDTLPKKRQPLQEQGQVYPMDIAGGHRHLGEPEPTGTTAGTVEVPQPKPKDSFEAQLSDAQAQRELWEGHLQQLEFTREQADRSGTPMDPQVYEEQRAKWQAKLDGAIQEQTRLQGLHEQYKSGHILESKAQDDRITELVKKNNQFFEDSLYKDTVNNDEWKRTEEEANRLILERANENKPKLQDKPVLFTDASGYNEISKLQEPAFATLTKRNDGKGWRLSYFDSDKDAVGHHDYTSWDEAYTALHTKDEYANLADWRPRMDVRQVLESRAPAPGEGQILESRVSAGDEFHFPLQEYDEKTNKLGKHTLPKNGVITIGALKNIGEQGKQLTDTSIELFKSLVPEAFGGDSVHVPNLIKGLKEKGPVVEVKKLTSEPTPEQSSLVTQLQGDRANLLHTLETQFPGYTVRGGILQGPDGWAFNRIGGPENEARYQALPQELRTYVERLRGIDASIDDLIEDVPDWEHVEGRASYSWIAPKETLPGYVEGLVRVPTKPGEVGANVGRSRSNLSSFRGPHFGEDDTNVLAFYRGYEETLPDGSKAFHVIEVQSDWGNSYKKNTKAYTNEAIQAGAKPEELNRRVEQIRRNAGDSTHPLLQVYESLALKAALQHARQIGATKIIVSDAETAMMSEGHDQQNYHRAQEGEYTLPNAPKEIRVNNEGRKDGGLVVPITGRFKFDASGGLPIIELSSGGWMKVKSLNADLADQFIKAANPRTIIDQEPGMRLHYDQTIPKTMEKLTGQKGETVDLGRHKEVAQYTDAVPRRPGDIGEEGLHLRGSPVFKNPDGTAKTQVTGRVYNVPQNPDERRGNILESRVSKQPLVDSMKAASEYVTEDENGLWFKPISMNHFKASFGPVFGDRLTPETHGDQEGFRASPVAFTNVTDADLALAPKPPVRTWAPSAFEMMKGLFVRNGETQENAEALAGYNLRMASLLKGTENAIWGKITKGSANAEKHKLLGSAFIGMKVAGLTDLAATPEKVGPVVRHEQTHLAGFSKNNTDITSDVRDSISTVSTIFRSLDQAERNSLLESLISLTDQRSSVYEIARTNPNEFASEFMAHVGDGLGNTPSPSAYVRDVMRFVPDELSALLTKTTLRRAQALENLRETVGQQAASRGIKDNWLQVAVTGLANTFKDMGREAMNIALDQADFYRMRNLYPDMYQQMVKSTASVVSKVERPGYILESRQPKLFTDAMKAFGMPSKDERLPQKISFWNRTVAQMSQFADDYPIARPFTDMMFASKALQNQRLIALHMALGGTFEGGRALDTQVTKQIAKFALDQTVRTMLNKIALDVQTEGDKATKNKLAAVGGDVMKVGNPVNIMTPQYMDAIYRKYGANPEQRKMLQTVLDGMRNQMVTIKDIIVHSHVTAMDTVVAKAIQKSTNLAPEPARQASVMLRNSIEALDASDQQRAVQLQNEFMSKVPDYNVAEKLYNMANDSYQGAKRLERFLAIRNPYYMSERRAGGYGVWWRGADDKMQSYYFKSEAERANFIQTKNIEPIRQTNPGDTNYGVSQDIFKQLDLIHDKVKEKLTDLYGEKDAQEMSNLMDFASELRQSLGARNALDISTQRKGAASRENLDMFDTHLNYVYGVVTAAKNRQMKLEADLLLDTPEFRNQPIIKDFLQGQLKSVMAPDTKIGKFVSMINFVYYMGMNMSSMVLEPFQQISAMAPILTRAGASIPASYAHLAWGNKLAIESKANKGRYKDAEINSYMERLRRDGVVDYGIITEMDHNTDLETINRIRAVGGLSLYTPFEMFKNRVYQAANLARRFYGQVPAYNSEVAALAAYKHLKSQGLSGEKLVNEASNLVRLAMFGGGKENRPGLFQLPGSEGRSAAQMMWSLQSYNTSMMSLMGRMIKDSTFNPKGLTPAQTAQTRKAAVQMLATQFVLAGALGMPFAQIGILALQKLFPEHNIEGLVRDFFNQFNGDDEAMGGWFGNALATGGISALTGADMGSRFALSSAMGVSPYSGISADNVIGPTASIAKNVFGAIQAGANGDPVKSVEQVMPKGILRIWKALEQGSTFVSPYSGKKTVDNLNFLEQVGRGIGFTPARVARIQDAERLSKMSESAANLAQQQWVSQQADDLTAGKDQSVHQAIAQRSLESKGTRSPEQLTRAIAQRVEDKTMPVDPRSFGSKQTVEAQRSMKGVLGEQSAGPSNMDRIMLQQSIAQRLGIPRAAPSRQTIQGANSLDMLLQMYPHLTKPQAALLLHRATASSPIAQELTASGE